MAIKKIPCGGWSYDDSEIVFEDGVIHPVGGGGSDAIIVNFELSYDEETESNNVTSDKTVTEVKTAILNGQNVRANLSMMGVSYPNSMLFAILVGGSSTEEYPTDVWVHFCAYLGEASNLETIIFEDIDTHEWRMG